MKNRVRAERLRTPGVTSPAAPSGWQCTSAIPERNLVVDTLPVIDKQENESWPAWAARDRQRVCMALIMRRAELHAMRFTGRGVG